MAIESHGLFLFYFMEISYTNRQKKIKNNKIQQNNN